DGSLARVADVIRARDAVAREFFAREPSRDWEASIPAETGAYLYALSALMESRSLAVDAGTGDGGLLEVLAPVYGRVVAVDRSDTQLARAHARATARGWENVDFVHGELDDPKIKEAVHGAKADAVFAARLLHHTPRPA